MRTLCPPRTSVRAAESNVQSPKTARIPEFSQNSRRGRSGDPRGSDASCTARRSNTMKNITKLATVGLVALALTACPKPEPAAPTTTEPAAVSTTAETTTDVTATDTTATGTGATESSATTTTETSTTT